MSQDSRHLEPVIRNFKVVEWTCSKCDWKKTAEDAAKATENTVVAFSNHECSEYPVGLNLTAKRGLLAFMWPQPA
jgi:hypothetical protein